MIHFANVFLAEFFQGDPCTWQASRQASVAGPGSPVRAAHAVREGPQHPRGAAALLGPGAAVHHVAHPQSQGGGGTRGPGHPVLRQRANLLGDRQLPDAAPSPPQWPERFNEQEEPSKVLGVAAVLGASG